jgi:hypothetical protein
MTKGGYLIETMDSKRSTSPKTQKRTSSPRSKGAQAVLPQDSSILAVTQPSLEVDADSGVTEVSSQSTAPSKVRRILGYEADWQRWDRLAQELGDTKDSQAELFHYLLQLAESRRPEQDLGQTASVLNENVPQLSPEQAMTELIAHTSLLSTMASLTVQFQQNQQQQQQLNLLLAQVLQVLTSGGSVELLRDFRQPGRKASEMSVLKKESFAALDSQNLKRSHAKGSAEEKLKRAFEAIVGHNEMPNHKHEDKWAINQNALAELTGCNRPAIKHFLKLYAADIDLHHQANGILPRHNYAHGKLGIKIADVISW